MLVVTAIAGLTILLLLYRVLRRNPGKQLPGPWGFPLFGHLPLLGRDPLKTIFKWQQSYGPIFITRFGSIPTVFISDPALMKEAFSKMALSGRPKGIPLTELCKYKGIAGGDTPETFELKKFALLHLKDFNSSSANQITLDTISELIRKLKRRAGKPQSLNSFFDIFILRGIWLLLFGGAVGFDAKVLDKALVLLGSVLELPNAWSLISYYMPWTKALIPSLLLKSSVEASHSSLMAMLRSNIHSSKASRVPGQPRGLVDAFYEEGGRTCSNPDSVFQDEEQILATSFDLFAAGTETAGSTLEWGIYFLAKNPQVQTKLQAEIDSVIGTSEAPSLAFRANMPYTEAVIQEVLRASSVVPLGLFHQALEDSSVAGFGIKKGTMLFGNLYGAHHDPRVWNDPEVFKPERFLTSEGKRENVVSFPPGRRACIGEAPARDQLFLYFVSMLQQLSFELSQDFKEEIKFGHTRRTPEFQVIVSER